MKLNKVLGLLVFLFFAWSCEIDDGGISTNEEIRDEDGNVVMPYIGQESNEVVDYPDADGDGIPDYLDEDTGYYFV